MKRLLGAFPETPEYVSSAIRAGVRKGQRRDARRRRLYAAASVAAVLAVMVGGLTFAIRRGGSPTPLATGLAPLASGAATAAATAIPSPTPEATPVASARPAATSAPYPAEMPSALPTEWPSAPPTEWPSAPPTEWPSAPPTADAYLTVPPEGALFYSTAGGKYYHAVPDCSGMAGAVARALGDVEALGQGPCPICLPETDATVDVDASARAVWTTDASAYYHDEGGCSGIRLNLSMSEAEAVAAGKALCPLCAANRVQPALDASVLWSTEFGTYYHVDPYCSGMVGAHERGPEEVRKLGQEPCPVCIGVGSVQVRGAWWDGDHLLLCYDVQVKDTLFVTTDIEDSDLSAMREVEDAQAELRAALTDAEAEDVLAQGKKGRAVYFERVRAELWPEDDRAPVARRAFRIGDSQRIFAMYAARSRAEMAFVARISEYAYYLDADGILYARMDVRADSSLSEGSSGGSYDMRGSDGSIDLSPLVGSWQPSQATSIGYGDGSATLKSLGGAFSGIVLMERDVSTFESALSPSLAVEGASIPLALEKDGDAGFVTVRALLTAEEADALLACPDLLQMRGGDSLAEADGENAEVVETAADAEAASGADRN